jgi:hypothetical protein
MYVIIFLLVISGILLMISMNNDDDYDNYIPPVPSPPEGPYLEPKEFTIGPVKQAVYKSANLCDPTVLKPIIPVYVDYESKMPNNCPCTKYLEPP